MRSILQLTMKDQDHSQFLIEYIKLRNRGLCFICANKVAYEFIQGEDYELNETCRSGCTPRRLQRRTKPRWTTKRRPSNVSHTTDDE